MELSMIWAVMPATKPLWEMTMTWGKGLLLWLIGIPLPIIILLALFWR
jgi:hypothetical protein